MAIEITRNTNSTTSDVCSPRTTGPLDPFSMVVSTGVDMLRGELFKRVRVPGVLVSDPEFVAAYEAGRESYFSTVEVTRDETGAERGSFSFDELMSGGIVAHKERDVTDVEVVELVEETMQPLDAYQLKLLGGDLSPAWRAGFIFGFVHACTDQADFGCCENCGARLGTCGH